MAGGAGSIGTLRRAAIYCRVSTNDQSCERQERELRAGAKVLAMINEGKSYRIVARRLDLSKNTVADIVKRTRAS